MTQSILQINKYLVKKQEASVLSLMGNRITILLSSCGMCCNVRLEKIFYNPVTTLGRATKVRVEIPLQIQTFYILGY